MAHQFKAARGWMLRIQHIAGHLMPLVEIIVLLQLPLLSFSLHPTLILCLVDQFALLPSDFEL